MGRGLEEFSAVPYKMSLEPADARSGRFGGGFAGSLEPDRGGRSKIWR